MILEVSGLTEASAPRILGEHLIFTYDFGADRHAGRVNSVEIAFAHEEYSVLRSFERNENNVFVYLHPLDSERDSYEYRLVVNGIWTADPANPERVRDRWGVQVSRTTAVLAERPAIAAPIIRSEREVEFFLSTRAGSRVTLAGSFNGWDPFMTELAELEPGFFSRTLRLGPGEHLYYFVVDGLRLPDPQNSNQRWLRSGVNVSVVSLP